MDVYQNYTRPRQSGDTTLVVIPATERYLEQMEQCHQAAYGYTAAEAALDDEALTVDKFRQHLQIFPEGQLLALEVETDTVVGTTSNMRVRFDPSRSQMHDWAATTDHG
jgi:hypothetical protein